MNIELQNYNFSVKLAIFAETQKNTGMYNIWIITGIVMLLSFIVERTLRKRMDKYSQIAVPNGMTGAQVARKMLEDNGIYDVTVKSISGSLTDHYNPADKSLNLSEDVYGVCSIAAAAVAAHECGHAVQHAKGYAPLKLRSLLVPAVNFCSKTVTWVILAGVLLISIIGPSVLYLGIALFAVTTFFSLVTLPVETNASNRAVKWLETAHITDSTTRPMAADALKWAAYTYVIAALGSLATLFYYIALARR